MIRLRQGLSDGYCRKIVIHRHRNPGSTGIVGSLRQMGRDAIRTDGGGQHRKADAIRRQGGEIYPIPAVQNDASHTGMP